MFVNLIDIADIASNDAQHDPEPFYPFVIQSHAAIIQEALK